MLEWQWGYQNFTGRYNQEDDLVRYVSKLEEYSLTRFWHLGWWLRTQSIRYHYKIHWRVPKCLKAKQGTLREIRHRLHSSGFNITWHSTWLSETQLWSSSLFWHIIPFEILGWTLKISGDHSSFILVTWPAGRLLSASLTLPGFWAPSLALL